VAIHNHRLSQLETDKSGISLGAPGGQGDRLSPLPVWRSKLAHITAREASAGERGAGGERGRTRRGRRARENAARVATGQPLRRDALSSAA